MTESELARFQAKIKIDEETSCWLWTGTILSTGYGTLAIGSSADATRTMAYVHRLAYRHFVGPIPDRKHIHHVCEVRRCANPFHLQAVTSKEHQAIHAKPLVAKCGNGHRYTPENLGVRRGGARYCRQCAREAVQRSHERIRYACKYGHEFTPENTIHKSGRRYCRACRAQNGTNTLNRTRCRRGHALTNSNVRVRKRKGRKDELICLTCANLRARAYVERKREHEPNRRWRAYKRPPDDDQVEATP